MSFFSKKTVENTGITAIDITDGGVSAIRVKPLRGAGAARYRLSLYDEYPCTDAQQRADALGKLCRRHGLDKARCTTVLDSNYKLILTDAPAVAPDEMRSALRWHVKDRVDKPVDEMTFDALAIPGSGSGQRDHEIYVVAADNGPLRERADLLQSAGINVQVIDIAETALRNIAALLPEDASGIAVLWLREETGLLALTRGGELYMSRTLNTGLQALRHATDSGRALEMLALEIQRSLDYYESHFRLPPLKNLYLAPLAEAVSGLVESLRSNIGLEAKPLVLDDLIRADMPLPDGWQARHLISIGAALRQE